MAAKVVLAIDTSSEAVVSALVRVDESDVVVVASRAPRAPRGHGELLGPSISELFQEANVHPRDLGAVVAGLGPGPFTGLRVGLVTAAAVADSYDIPSYGVCSLDAIGAYDAVVVTDARRHEVYWARYDEHGHRAEGPDVAFPQDVAFDATDAVTGAAVELYPDAWPATVTRMRHKYPDPRFLVAMAQDRIRSGAASEVLEPMYLRRPDAVVPTIPKRVTP